MFAATRSSVIAQKVRGPKYWRIVSEYSAGAYTGLCEVQFYAVVGAASGTTGLMTPADSVTATPTGLSYGPEVLIDGIASSSANSWAGTNGQVIFTFTTGGFFAKELGIFPQGVGEVNRAPARIRVLYSYDNLVWTEVKYIPTAGAYVANQWKYFNLT